MSPHKVLLLLFVAFGVPFAKAQTASDVSCLGCIGASDIAAGAVTNSKIANGAIGNNKIANSAVSNAKIQSSAVSTSNIQNGAITFSKLSTDVQNALSNVSSSVTVTTYRVSNFDTDGVVGLSCPTGTGVLSAGCYCNNGGQSDRSYGVVFSCQVAGNGGVGACYPYPLDYSKPVPVAEISVLCGEEVALPQSLTDKPDEMEQLNELSAKIEEVEAQLEGFRQAQVESSY